MFTIVSDERNAEFLELGVPTQMKIYLMIAKIRRQQKNSGTVNENLSNNYKNRRKDALSNKVEGDFWYRPLVISSPDYEVPNQNVLVTGQRIYFNQHEIGAGGFSKIYKHKFNSTYEAVKVLDITGEFGAVFTSQNKNEPTRDCSYDGKDKHTELHTQIFF